MSTRQYGTFQVRDREVCTIYVKAGDRVAVTAPSSDRIHLGGFLGFDGDIGPDGRPERAGDNFPAPELRRHSLIFRIGHSAWQQGGSNARPVTAPVDGQVVLHINDDLLNDNGGGWNVTVTRTTAEGIDDLPRAGSGALFQSIDGNMRFIATGNQGSSAYRDEINLLTFQRDRAANWTRTPNITAQYGVTLPREDAAYRYPSWFQATDGQHWCVCVQGTQVKYFVQGTSPRDVPGANDCVGAPAMIQSRHGKLGNFELVYPARSGRMKHRFALTDDRPCEWHAPLNWHARVHEFGDPAFQVQSVRLLQSDWGNMEAIALERAASRAWQLRHWWRHDNVTWQWYSDPVRSVLPRSNEIRENCIPGFIQSSFRTGNGPHGNYEVIAPAQYGGLMHWYFDFGTWEGWRLRLIDERGRQVKAVHLLQSNFGARRNNFEIVAETGERLYPYVGFGSLLFYYCNNDNANNSHEGIWGGPFQLSFS